MNQPSVERHKRALAIDQDFDMEGAPAKRSPTGGSPSSREHRAAGARAQDGDPGQEVQRLWDALQQKDATILVLQKKLGHYRQWVTALHGSVSSVNPAAIKNSRRVYVGGVPQGTSDEELRSFFGNMMQLAGALIAPGPAISSCRIAQDKGFAFLEMRSVEEASNAMAFDGVLFKDVYLKVRRPSNYDPSTAIMLGPVTPDPTIDASGMAICRTVVDDSWQKLFIGGLPSDWADEQVKELLAPYGVLRSFNLVMDKTTGKSKGYAFCEFEQDGDAGVTDAVIAALNGRTLNKKVLTVKRALEGARSGAKQHAGAPLGVSPPHPHHHPSGMLAPLHHALGAHEGSASHLGSPASGNGAARGTPTPDGGGGRAAAHGPGGFAGAPPTCEASGSPLGSNASGSSSYQPLLHGGHPLGMVHSGVGQLGVPMGPPEGASHKGLAPGVCGGGEEVGVYGGGLPPQGTGYGAAATHPGPRAAPPVVHAPVDVVATAGGYGHAPYW